MYGADSFKGRDAARSRCSHELLAQRRWEGPGIWMTWTPPESKEEMAPVCGELGYYKNLDLHVRRSVDGGRRVEVHY